MLKENLKKYRRLKNYTQKELASKTGVSAGYVQMIELGKKNNPSIDLLQKIADALEVSINDLLGTSENFESDFDISKLGDHVQRYIMMWRNALNEVYKGKYFSNTDIVRNILINDIARDNARAEVKLNPEQNMSILFMTSGDKPLEPELLYKILKEEYVKNFKIERKKELAPIIYEADKMALEGTELPDYLKDAVIEYYEDWFIEKVPPQFRKYLEKNSEIKPEDEKFKEDMKQNRLSFYAGIVDIALKEVSEGRDLDELGLQAVKEYYKESSTEDIPEVFRKYFKK